MSFLTLKYLDFLFELNKQPTIADNDSMSDVNKTQTAATKQNSGSDDDSADELLKDTQYLLGKLTRRHQYDVV